MVIRFKRTSSVSIWQHDTLKHHTTRYTIYPFFNYTRSEMSQAYQHFKLQTKKAIVISPQSSAASHLLKVIKTFDISFNKDKRSISKMEISLSFSSSQGGQRVHTFWEKTTLILMHRLATCQDRVSSLHEALSSKHPGSDVWEIVTEIVFQLQIVNFSFFLLKLAAQFFRLAHKENLAFQVQIDPNRALQSISRCNKQPNCSFKWAHPLNIGNRESASENLLTTVLSTDLVCATVYEGENVATWTENHLHLQVINKCSKEGDLNMHHRHKHNVPAVFFFLSCQLYETLLRLQMDSE